MGAYYAPDIRHDLIGVRTQAILLRRYLAPQREAIAKVQREELSWFSRRDRAQLGEVTDRVIRYVEDLDAVRERAAVIQDELSNRMSERMNRNMYLLALVATVMLPLGFVTGLLGINVDGMPGAQNSPFAFLIVCLFLGGLVALQVWVLRRFGWLR